MSPGGADGTDAPAGGPEGGRHDWEWARERVEDVLLGGPRRYTRHDVRADSGLSPEHATRLWNALGFPSVPDDDIAFTDADLAALRLTAGLLEDDTFDETEELAIARVLGQLVGRLAEWQANLLRRRAVAQGMTDPDSLVASAESLIPALEHLQGYAWRRHLAVTASRMMSDLARPEDEQARPENVTVVGFADIVGFTALSRKVSETELRSLLEHFEAASAAVVARHGGRIVKTLGDEVLFVVSDTREALETALDLQAEIPDAEGGLELRIGMARGPVLPRYGDVYGPTVNIASRLTSHARAGTVLVDEGLTEAVRDDEDYELRKVPAMSVRGYQHLRPHVLRRPGRA